MRSIGIATLAAIGLASCANPRAEMLSNGGCQGTFDACADRQTQNANDIWFRMYCDPNETYERCEARMNVEAGIDANERPAVPRQSGPLQAQSYGLDKQTYCRTQGQMAMAIHSEGLLMPYAWGNHVYATCMGYE